MKTPPSSTPPDTKPPPTSTTFAYQLLCMGRNRMFGAKIFLNIYLTVIIPIFLADESTIWTTSLMESTSQRTQRTQPIQPSQPSHPSQPRQTSQPSQPSQPSQTSQPGQTTETSEPRNTRRYHLASSSLPTYIIYQVITICQSN